MFLFIVYILLFCYFVISLIHVLFQVYFCHFFFLVFVLIKIFYFIFIFFSLSSFLIFFSFSEFYVSLIFLFFCSDCFCIFSPLHQYIDSVHHSSFVFALFWFSYLNYPPHFYTEIYHLKSSTRLLTLPENLNCQELSWHTYITLINLSNDLYNLSAWFLFHMITYPRS